MNVTHLVLPLLGFLPQDVKVDVLPVTPLIERHRSHLSLQWDFLISNNSPSPVTLSELVLRELDAESNLIRRRSVNQNGTAPSIHTIINGPVLAGGMTHVFNPFHQIELESAPTRLEFLFTFRSGGTPWTETVSLDGKIYETRTALRLPINGRLMVEDGHEYFSHHRRLAWDHPAVQALGLKVNSGRYSNDFVLLGPDGSPTRRTPTSPEDWYGWGAPVVAPGRGRIVKMVNDFPDNTYAGQQVVQSSRVTTSNMDTFAGNFVVIDHGDGEFSTLGHMRKGSVVVEVGQDVEAGDPIGGIGLSGSQYTVSLHWQLQDSSSLGGSSGLPSSLARYRLHRGNNSRVVLNAPVDTGDIIEHVEDED